VEAHTLAGAVVAFKIQARLLALAGQVVAVRAVSVMA
jgi:hypothetical protein